MGAQTVMRQPKVACGWPVAMVQPVAAVACCTGRCRSLLPAQQLEVMQVSPSPFATRSHSALSCMLRLSSG